jgi:hypothetical protein
MRNLGGCLGLFQLSNIIEDGVAALPNWRTIHQSDSTVVELSLVALGSANLAGYWLFCRDIFLECKRLWIWFRTTVLGRSLPEKEWLVPTLPPG